MKIWSMMQLHPYFRVFGSLCGSIHPWQRIVIWVWKCCMKRKGSCSLTRISGIALHCNPIEPDEGFPQLIHALSRCFLPLRPPKLPLGHIPKPRIKTKVEGASSLYCLWQIRHFTVPFVPICFLKKKQSRSEGDVTQLGTSLHALERMFGMY